LPPGGGFVEPEVPGIVVERDVLRILGINRPVELVAEERDQLAERADVAELFGFADVGGHGRKGEIMKDEL